MIRPLLIPIHHARMYWELAALTGLYYAYRGWRIQLREKSKDWGMKDVVLVHGLQDGIFHFVCALAGYAALYVECKMLIFLPAGTPMSLGSAAALVFLSVLAILGIGGAIPSILIQGLRRPRP